MSVSLPVAVRLPLPAAVDRHHILWSYAGTLLVWHCVALLAVLPWFFSVTGLVLAIAGIYVFGGLGITLCYHRLLTHRGLACPKWLEYSFAILGVCAMQDTPARWVAVHRRHHEHADQREDPHSPLVDFFWGHVGWMLVENADLVRLGIYDRYSKNILRDRFYRRLERTYLYPQSSSRPGPSSSRRFRGRYAEWNRRGRGLAVRREPVDLGCIRARGPGLARHLAGELSIASVGLPHI